jgi:hypothetical protein
MFAGALFNGAGQIAQDARVQNAAVLIAGAVAPEATFVGQGVRLYRAAKGTESVSRLARQAAEAEEAIGIHGVSPHTNPQKFRNPAEAAPGASLDEVQQHFPVQQTGRDPGHHTVILPKPVTQKTADLIRALFRDPK